ncbi:hypothetical protein K525DRAFT_277719 [Schizophyllum commune Loenen D]|nr:hypothetical protein K525DRAFT_277719 [Schizophyllum commune Loenen D]
MSHIASYNGTNIIGLPMPAYRLPENPLIMDRDPSSIGDGSQATDAQRTKSFRTLLLRKDMRSLVTGSPATDLQGCHILNAVRVGSSSSPQRATKEKQRQSVIALCNHLGFGGMNLPPAFDLDNIMNGILLESSLHVNWDMYATFAIIVPQTHLLKMIDQLRRDNAIWDQKAETDERAVRVLGVAEPRVHNYTIEELTVVALSPAFLPQGSSLAVLSHEHRSLVNTHPTAWQQRRLDIGNQHCLSFPLPPSHRGRAEQLSIFALITHSWFSTSARRRRGLSPARSAVGGEGGNRNVVRAEFAKGKDEGGWRVKSMENAALGTKEDDNPDIEVVGSENDSILDELDAQKGSTLARQNAASP